MRTDDDLSQRRDDMTVAIYNTVNDHRDPIYRRNENLSEKRFGDAEADPDGTCADDWIVILFAILEWAPTDGTRRSADAIATSILDKAQSAVNLGNKKWSASFLGRSLRFNGAPLPRDKAHRINVALANSVARSISDDWNNPPDFRSLVGADLPLWEAIRAAVDAVPMRRIPRWKRPFDYVSHCDPSFSTDPVSFDDDGLAAQAQAALGYQDLSWSALHYGVGPGQIPRYLLICASPMEIPWRIQYALQFACFTGRLDLVGDALENHLQALVSSWAASQVNPLVQLLWAVVHNAEDITWLLRATITGPLTDA